MADQLTAINAFRDLSGSVHASLLTRVAKMVDRNNAADGGDILSVLASPALIVSALLALVGMYLWTEHRDEALVAFLWIPVFLTCCVTHFFFHTRRHSSH
jgi:phosphoglycerol transferase MdoB-like AlkP superfamily enzyme